MEQQGAFTGQTRNAGKKQDKSEGYYGKCSDRNIMTRRTIRRFDTKQISEEELQTILDAGLYAPSAGGRQGVLFVVSQNKETNEKLGRIKKSNSNVKMSTDTVYISKEQPNIADDPTITNAFYDAPTVVTLFVPKNFLYGPYDASVAAENMLLEHIPLARRMLYRLGMGQFS